MHVSVGAGHVVFLLPQVNTRTVEDIGDVADICDLFLVLLFGLFLSGSWGRAHGARHG